MPHNVSLIIFNPHRSDALVKHYGSGIDFLLSDNFVRIAESSPSVETLGFPGKIHGHWPEAEDEGLNLAIGGRN